MNHEGARKPGWVSRLFQSSGYGARDGYAHMHKGIVGDVVASISLEMDDGSFEKVSYLRFDPARMTVDLLMKVDLDSPWSLESSKPTRPTQEADLLEAANSTELDCAAMFDLMLAVNNDLEIHDREPD